MGLSGQVQIDTQTNPCLYYHHFMLQKLLLLERTKGTIFTWFESIKCFKNEFKKVSIATDGILKSFTIVAFAAPGVPVPFVAGIIDCAGTSVRGNVINTDPTPEKVSLGMKVRLATFSLGTDDEGSEAIGFGFEPA